MKQNWAERLAAAKTEGLSRRELDLIDFISSEPHEAAFLRQSDLSVRAGVSKPVVISCFRRLGYSNYQTFLAGIQEFYAGQIDSAQAASVAFKDVTDVASLVAHALRVEATTLQTLERHLDPHQVEAVARSVIAAGTVYFYAEGSGYVPAHYLSQRLRRCGIRAFMLGGDRPHVVDDLAVLKSGDLVVSFYYTQDRLQVGDLLEYVRRAGATSVLITGTADADFYQKADYHVFVPRGQWNFKNSLAAPMAFAQILLLTVEFLGGSELREKLKKLESTRREFGSSKKEEAL